MSGGGAWLLLLGLPCLHVLHCFNGAFPLPLGPTHMQLVPSCNVLCTLKRTVPYPQGPSLTRSADAGAASSQPMWPLTVSGLQWGRCSLESCKRIHAKPVHKAGETDKKEHWLIVAVKLNKWNMTWTQSGFRKIWSYIKNAEVDQSATSRFIKACTPKTSCRCRPSVSRQIGEFT